MSNPLKRRLRAILSSFSIQVESPDSAQSGWRPPLPVRFGLVLTSFLSQACTLIGGGIKVFIIYPIGLLVFCALVVASVNNDAAPDVTIVSGIYETVIGATQGAPSGHINLFKCADPIVPLDKGPLDHAASICQNPSVTVVPLSEGIPLLAQQLTGPLRLFYAMAVIMVFGVMFMSGKWSAHKAWPLHVFERVGTSDVGETRSMLHMANAQTGVAATVKGPDPAEVKKSV